MKFNETERKAIDNLAAMFFEKSDDLIAVSHQIETVIDRRRKILMEREENPLYFSSFNSKPERTREEVSRDYYLKSGRANSRRRG